MVAREEGDRKPKKNLSNGFFKKGLLMTAGIKKKRNTIKTRRRTERDTTKVWENNFFGGQIKKPGQRGTWNQGGRPQLCKKGGSCG